MPPLVLTIPRLLALLAAGAICVLLSWFVPPVLHHALLNNRWLRIGAEHPATKSELELWARIAPTAPIPNSPVGRHISSIAYKITSVHSGEQMEMPSVYAFQTGWPFVAFEGTQYWRPDVTGPNETGFVPYRANGRSVSIPSSIHWWGVAGNWLVSAALVLIAARAVSLVCRGRRRRRGECTACRYPLKGAAQCPECGLSHGESAWRVRFRTV